MRRTGVRRRARAEALVDALGRHPLHAYALCELLNREGVRCSRRSVYVELWALEDEGVLRSSLDTDGPGPARRVYELADA